MMDGFNVMMNLIPLTLALIGATIATYTDLKEKRVPNRLTFPLIAVGMAFYAACGLFQRDISVAVLGFCGAGVGFALGYPLYLFGGFGGGDVKLIVAIGALLPVAPITVVNHNAVVFTGLPLFPVTVLINGLVVSFPFIIGYALLCLIRGEKIFTKEVAVSDLQRRGKFDGPQEVKRTFPFAPVIAAGTFLGAFLGNIYLAFLTFPKSFGGA